MNNRCKRNLPQRKLSKFIYIFYDDLVIGPRLRIMAHELANIHNCWLMKDYVHHSPLTNSEILRKINTAYHNYDRHLDKICVISSNQSETVRSSKIMIECFSNITKFEAWLNQLKAF
ncbi:hypothetical protein [Anaerosinus massiliensis]|uniref:hypothetical protein n=1 Tax=Massilibacillus massiliensis TaxID=1806837 RepID=UPI000DA62530|nr:hypothetical protein [Massilibacillus massiliensis]